LEIGSEATSINLLSDLDQAKIIIAREIKEAKEFPFRIESKRFYAIIPGLPVDYMFYCKLNVWLKASDYEMTWSWDEPCEIVTDMSIHMI
jgi:hypothetical protein